MFRISVALLAAVMTLAPLGQASAQSRDQRDERQSSQRRDDRPPPRVSPDEARRQAERSSGGRSIDTRVRPDGNYGVLVENGGRVREVVVDGGQQQSPQRRPR